MKIINWGSTTYNINWPKRVFTPNFRAVKLNRVVFTAILAPPSMSSFLVKKEKKVFRDIKTRPSLSTYEYYINPNEQLLHNWYQWRGCRRTAVLFLRCIGLCQQAAKGNRAPSKGSSGHSKLWELRLSIRMYTMYSFH